MTLPSKASQRAVPLAFMNWPGPGRLCPELEGPGGGNFFPGRAAPSERLLDSKRGVTRRADAAVNSLYVPGLAFTPRRGRGGGWGQRLTVRVRAAQEAITAASSSRWIQIQIRVGPLKDGPAGPGVHNNLTPY
jgi:hypothetical protein